MRRRKFRLSHSVVGLILLGLVEWALVAFFPVGLSGWLVLVGAALGALTTIYVATEVIEEVRNAQHMLLLLFIVVGEFVLFFAFEYLFLLLVSPNSFVGLTTDPVTLLLHSLMIFVFNPLYLPANALGRILLIIDVIGALGLVLFILQNVWQFRRQTE